MASELSTTSYALLGLLVFDAESSDNGLTGYELKQRADRTLRFYWTSPATSQIYTEMSRLHGRGLVDPLEIRNGRRTTRRYRITTEGQRRLKDWLRTSEPGFPVLKHPVALRLLMGHLLDPETLHELLDQYRDSLAVRRDELQQVRDLLGDDPDLRFPAMVADWGLHYYASEDEIADEIAARLARRVGS